MTSHNVIDKNPLSTAIVIIVASIAPDTVHIFPTLAIELYRCIGGRMERTWFTGAAAFIVRLRQFFPLFTHWVWLTQHSPAPNLSIDTVTPLAGFISRNFVAVIVHSTVIVLARPKTCKPSECIL